MWGGTTQYWLVVSTPLIILVGIIVPNIWTNRICSKPPTRSLYIRLYHMILPPNSAQGDLQATPFDLDFNIFNDDMFMPCIEIDL